jgi:tetratricopeptide (TPR) repeat protein
MRLCFITRTFAAALPLILGLEGAQPTGAAADAPAAASTPASRAEAAYRQLRLRYESQPSNIVAAWKFASACFDECEFSRKDADRARVANQGIAACRQALSLDPKAVGAHYFLGMDLAQLARTEMIGALNLLEEVEKEWETAIKLDENFDYAGPDRNLGLLYRDAPGWPLSIGNRAKAREHMFRAVTLHPDYPENHLNLIEALLKWDTHSEAAQAAAALEQILPEARKKFTGPDWESSWDDWNTRWKAIQAKLRPPSGLVPPHQRR